ncbi:MAG: TIGR00300 family protein [Candidatus Nitrosocaldaceae archaeon]|nr:MAG: TIGR00300 family protein [Candidatus Nitrosocaldaceae archaeon]
MFEQEIEVEGHLIDSMILTRIFDTIMDLKGEFEVVEFRIGKAKTDPSYARLIIKADSKDKLDRILEEVYREGASPITIEEVRLEEAPKDMVMPDDFYSTTNNKTYIYYRNNWIEVEDIMMDKCIVFDPNTNRAFCKPIRDVKKGDLIVVGEKGVKVVPPERPREGVDVFQFMSSIASSERPTIHMVKKIAKDMYEIKKRNGKILVVSGPAVVHTGVADALAELIRRGYIDGLMAGNALAVHDIENALFGTSLGMHVHDGSLAVRGHRNHMRAINEVFKAGSIKDMVEQGKLTKGIMYECIKNNIPFVLAGSLRDDGPIPDVITDVVEAQRKHRELLKNTDMVLMISTMLHSIAVGNMLNANVKVVVVDINQPMVTKLLDRGTWQAIGIVSDVGAFLPLLLDNIKKLEGS